MKKQIYEVEFTARFKARVKCSPDDLQDMARDVDIPESNYASYVGGTFEIVKIKNCKNPGAYPIVQEENNEQ